MVQKLIKLKALWIFMAVLFTVHIIFFASGIFSLLFGILFYLLLPIIAIVMAWGSYTVGKDIQRKCKLKIFWKIIFSFVVATIVSASYWITNDIYNGIENGHLTVFHTIEYLSSIFNGRFPLSGSEIFYIEFIIVFVFILIGFATQTYREKES